MRTVPRSGAHQRRNWKKARSIMRWRGNQSKRRRRGRQSSWTACTVSPVISSSERKAPRYFYIHVSYCTLEYRTIGNFMKPIPVDSYFLSSFWLFIAFLPKNCKNLDLDDLQY
jgi:hypothetical protein